MSSNSEQLLRNYQQVLERISDIANKSGNKAAPRLLAVSKTKPAHMIEALYAEGQRDFGENYLQDALDKITQLSNLDALRWHFIGQIQSNKTSTIAQHFTWAHSVDRLKIARRLSAQRPDGLPPLNICLQIDLDNEPQKGGISPKDLTPIAIEVAKLPNIQLRGLMCIPKPRNSFAEQKSCFAEVAGLLENLKQAGLTLDTLSMGMSKDLDAAVAAGSTMLRIGSDIFGARN